MMIKRLALLTCLLAPLVAQADPCRVGTVTSVTGPEVQLKRGTQQFTPGTGQTLCQGDTFITGANSIVSLHLRDGTVITVGKSSQFVIHEYHLYQHKPSIALFDLVQGALRGVTGLIARHSHRLEITTNVATIGIRGTTFWGGYGLTPDGAVDVVMLDGHGVYVKTAAGQVELDKPGLGTTVMAGGGAPAAPKSWPTDKLQRAIATVTVDAAPAPAASSAPAS
jgi:hypothetical protein